MFSLERLKSMLPGCTEDELEEYLLSGTQDLLCKSPLNEAWRQVRLKGDDMNRIALLLQNFCNGTPDRYGFLKDERIALGNRLRRTRFVDPTLEDADIGAERFLMDWSISVVRYGSPLQNELYDLYNDSAKSPQSMTSTEYMAMLSLAMVRNTSLTWFEQEVQPLKKVVLESYKSRHSEAGRAGSNWYLPKATGSWQTDTDYIRDIAKHDFPDVLENLPDNSKIKAVCTDPKVVTGLLCAQTPNTNDPVKALKLYLKDSLKFDVDEQKPLDQQAQGLAACMEKNWETRFGDLFQPKRRASEGAKLPQRGLQMVLRLLLGASTGMMGGETSQRGSIIRAAFAIEADCETLDRMLYSFDLAGIDYKDANEQIFAYTLTKKRDYNFASLMAKVYNVMCENEWVSAEAEQSEWRPTQYWKRDSVHQYGSAKPKDFLTYLRENGFRTGKRKISGMQHIFTSREFYTLCRFNSLKLHVMKEQYDRLCEMTRTVQDALKDLNMGRVDKDFKNQYLRWKDLTLSDESAAYARVKAEMEEVLFFCRDSEQMDTIEEEISLLISQLKKGDLLTRSQFFLLSLCEHKVRGAPYSEFFKNLENDLKNSRYEPVDEEVEKALLDKARAMLDKEHDER